LQALVNKSLFEWFVCKGFFDGKGVIYMKENFSEKIDKFLKEVMEVSPTLEELKANFPHKGECSRLSSLRRTEKDGFVASDGLNSGWVRGPFVRVTKKYLECDECHIQARFVE